VNPNRFGYLNFRLQGRRYRAKRIEAESLDNLNPFDLVAREVPGARDTMGQITIAVIGAVLPGEKKGFVILVDQAQSNGTDGPSAESLLDATCSAAS
jgi:CDP-diacylglycerol pyrophosphatase